MKTYTVSDVMKLRPCYSQEKVAKLWGYRQALSLYEIAHLDIPPQDVIWACARLMDPVSRQAFANLVAGKAVRKHCLHCGIQIVEQWAKRWLSGIDRSANAAYTADAAADAYAANAASAASAAAYAASDAAYAAYAASDAAYAAADAYAYAAPASRQQQQLVDLRAIIIWGKK